MIERLRRARPFLGLTAHRVGERAEAIDLARLARRELGAALRIAFAGDEVLRVRAAVLDELALVDVQHARDRLVEQLEVVTDHEEPTAERPQELHEPLLGVDVEVVRRLVEQEEVAAGEQDPGELHPPPLSPRQRGDRQVETIRPETEPGRDAANLRVGRVATGVAVPILGIAVRPNIARRCVVGHPPVELVETAAGRIESAGRQHVRERSAVEPGTPRRGVLRQISDRTRSGDHTVRGGRVTGQNLQERGLADAVAADETDLVSGAQRERCAGQRVPATNFHREIAYLEHR